MNTRKNEAIFLSGTGIDVHAVETTANIHDIVLCGVKIPCHYRVLAHSDGDVGLHALVDALLGAIGAGDIGEHFPPSDQRWKNADSSQFVTHALQLCHAKHAAVMNVDITFLCELPKIVPHKIAMKETIATLLCIPSERVNIKATTTEKLGFLGRSEGIAAQAIVTVKMDL